MHTPSIFLNINNTSKTRIGFSFWNNLNFIQEIRFTKGDDFWLSGCYKRDALWLGLYNYEHEKWDKVLPAYEAFAKQFNGRPHWGKEFSRDKNYLHQQYERIEDFKKLKNEMDPTKKFENKLVRQGANGVLVAQLVEVAVLEAEG